MAIFKNRIENVINLLEDHNIFPSKFINKEIKNKSNVIPLEYNLIPVFIYSALIKNEIPIFPIDIIIWMKKNIIEYLNGITSYVEPKLRFKKLKLSKYTLI